MTFSLIETSRSTLFCWGNAPTLRLTYTLAWAMNVLWIYLRWSNSWKTKKTKLLKNETIIYSPVRTWTIPVAVLTAELVEKIAPYRFCRLSLWYRQNCVRIRKKRAKIYWRPVFFPQYRYTTSLMHTKMRNQVLPLKTVPTPNYNAYAYRIRNIDWIILEMFTNHEWGASAIL